MHCVPTIVLAKDVCLTVVQLIVSLALARCRCDARAWLAFGKYYQSCCVFQVGLLYCPSAVIHSCEIFGWGGMAWDEGVWSVLGACESRLHHRILATIGQKPSLLYVVHWCDIKPAIVPPSVGRAIARAGDRRAILGVVKAHLTFLGAVNGS